MVRLVSVLALLLPLVACTPPRPVPPQLFAGPRTPVSGYVVKHVYSHDAQAFTQGLEYREGALYEGTGLQGRSTLRKVDLLTGRVLQQTPLPATYFGEGITLWNDSIMQLTWRSHMGFVYESGSLKQRSTFTYSGEGWGLTHDSSRLIMSDGSARLRFLDPTTLQEMGERLLVTDAGVPITHLNELECVNGELYANVWHTNFVARISPTTGRVMEWINLAGLLTAAEASKADVLNGIAYDAQEKRLFVTGKLWPKLFEIEIRPQLLSSSRTR